MPFTGKVGDSIFIDDRGGGHRYIILTGPDNDDEVVIVNFTEAKADKDCTTIFERRDHSGLFHKPTIVNYPQASFISLSKLKAEAAKSDCKYFCCPNSILDKIIIGAFRSDFTPIGIQAELGKQYPNTAKRYHKKYSK